MSGTASPPGGKPPTSELRPGAGTAAARPAEGGRESRLAEQVRSFRHSAPYIQAHRDRVFVVQFGGEAVEAPTFHALMSDLALLESLGVQLVLVHGARPQIERRLNTLGERSTIFDDMRVTDSPTIDAVRDAAGEVRLRIEARLAMGLANTPGHEYASAGAWSRSVRVSSGNWVTARPYGVHGGVDYQYTGQVRRVDTDAIRSALDAGHTVVLPPLGFSSTGDLFNLRAEDVATRVAIELGAAKLLFLGEHGGLEDEHGELARELTLEQARQLANRLQGERNRGDQSGVRVPAASDDKPGVRVPAASDDDTVRQLRNAVHACVNGVKRVHLLSRHHDGALLGELYTRDGVGTMINADAYDTIRPATLDDIGGILRLVEPLEQSGALIARTREKLESDIANFYVDDRDGAIVACAAAYDLQAEAVGDAVGDVGYATSLGATTLGDDEKMFELACLAVDDAYRKQDRGDQLLKAVERHARAHGATHLAVLTTQATHWFKERGFEDVQPSALPRERLSRYDPLRGSKVLIKRI